MNGRRVEFCRSTRLTTQPSGTTPACHRRVSAAWRQLCVGNGPKRKSPDHALCMVRRGLEWFASLLNRPKQRCARAFP